MFPVPNLAPITLRHVWDKVTYRNHNNFYVNVDSGTLIVLIPLIVILFYVMVVTLFYKSLTKRKRVPTVVSVHDEFPQRISTTNYNSHIQDAEESRIHQIINRIREIERKIEIVKSQNISEEAKNITIRELEEEKKMLEEEIKKYLI
jgi:hypothetical protein